MTFEKVKTGELGLDRLKIAKRCRTIRSHDQ